jgi:ribonucleoside-diphosphate reductase alpha chain
VTSPIRKRLPKRRTGHTIEASVGGHLVVVTTGEYADGTIGEVFIDMHKEGSAFRSVMNCVAILTSLCLQHGVPLDLIVKRFTGMRFEPDGVVKGHATIAHATSVIDFIFRAVGELYAANDNAVSVEVYPESTRPALTRETR